MNNETIKQLINQRFPSQYTDEILEEVVLPDIKHLPIEIKTKLFNFLKSGVIDDIEVEGYSVEKLKRDGYGNEIASYCNLGWLMEEPEVAKRALRAGIK